MTDSDWQGDMLRRMSAQQPPADEPSESAPQPPAQQQPAVPEQPVAPDQPQEQWYPPPQPGYYQQSGPPPQYQPPPPPPYEQQGYPPYHQQPPGQMPPPGQVPYQPAPGDPWGQPPQPQSDRLGRPAPVEGDSVFRRFRRIASEAAFLVGASGRMERDVDNIATVRRPIAIMRRVGVLSPVLNGGTSTVVALLSTMLAAQRSDRVVALDTDPAGAELSRRLEPAFGAGAIEGVTLVRADGNAAAVRSTLAEVQGQGARDVGLAVVDCPGTMYDEVGAELAVSGHCTVLVLPSARQIAEYALAQLDQLAPAGQDVLLNRGVVVITMVEDAPASSVGWLVDAFRQRGLEPVVLPYDDHVAQSWPLHSERLQPETRRAVLELAARVVGTVTGAPS
ncbi:MinD/ParA family ATP-binding protein [Kribbella sp. GL6]|uniref:MinD/ParA family ATP-binding protein n=1 Tax=Kribbella sp. GL6 TaxID=3419765 RepID=UPI003D03811E